MELAKLGTTLIEGGYIKTSLINANAIRISGGLASTTDIKNAIDAVKIGGVNLLKFSASIATIPNTNIWWASEVNYNYPDHEGGSGAAEIKTGSKMSVMRIAKIAFDTQVQSFTFSIWAKASSVPVNFKLELCDTGVFFTATNQWQRYVVQINTAQYNSALGVFADIEILTHHAGLIIYKPKVEYGNKSTDWSPAPEDVAADAQAKVNALKNTLGALAWDSKVELAKHGTTLIEGGYIKTNLINANAIRISGGLATTGDVNKAVNDIQIGGRNLAKNSINYIGWRTNIPVSDINTQTGIVKMASIGSEKYILPHEGTIMGIAGQTYTASYKVLCENLDKGLCVPIYYDGKWQPQHYNYSDIKHTNGQWVVISKTFTPSTNGAISFALDNYMNTTGIIYAKEGKLEKGNKPTDWTPAPEDVQADAQAKVDALKGSLGALAWKSTVEQAMLGTTLIQGGYIKTELINVEAIKATIISAEAISALAVDFQQGTIGGFKINANSITSFNNKIILNNDGSGLFAGGKLRFDILGNIFVDGRLSTSFKEIPPPFFNNKLSIGSNNIIITYSKLDSQLKAFDVQEGIDGAIVYFLIKCTELAPNNSFNSFVIGSISNNSITIYRRTSGFSYTYYLIALMYIKAINKWIKLFDKNGQV